MEYYEEHAQLSGRSSDPALGEDQRRRARLMTRVMEAIDPEQADLSDMCDDIERLVESTGLTLDQVLRVLTRLEKWELETDENGSHRLWTQIS